ncbi:MAG: DNA replication/repair protein RecF [Pseudomarimonas sp.]
MRVERLRVERLRIIESVEIEPGPGIALLIGPNGSGKTSVLEALHVLAYGRSFRSPSREVLIRRDCDDFSIFAEVQLEADAARRRIGFACSARAWQARVDGNSVSTLSELLRLCPMVCFEPGSHALIAGSSELRRRFLDWGLFHVEPTFTGVWRRYQRSLKQRNALLKCGQGREGLDAWDAEIADSGEQLHALRQGYASALLDHVAAAGADLMPEVGRPVLRYTAGWRNDRDSLAQALSHSRDRDMATGHTNVGPHRANWDLTYPGLPQRESFSRGQEKLTALICVIAQAQHFAKLCGHWPLIALDDLASEIDQEHQRRAIAAVANVAAQVWITGTAEPAGLEPYRDSLTSFHVEQGRVRRAV